MGKIYFEIAEGTVKNRNIIVPMEELSAKILKARDSKSELYRSFYAYDEDIFEHFKTRKTVSGYKGKFYLKEIILDIDKGEHSDEFVLKCAREFVRGLNDDFRIPFIGMKIFYSGRGYHIHIPDYFNFEPSNVLPQIVKATFTEIFPEIDPAPLMGTGLIRMQHTINNKSNRYKIALTDDELFQYDAEEIMNLAEVGEMRKLEFEKADVNLSGRIVMPKIEKVEMNKSELTGVVTCMQKLYLRGPIKGQRHIEMLRLVSSWRRRGDTIPEAVAKLTAWDESMEKAEIVKTINDIYSKKYEYSCQDKIMLANCDSICKYYANKNYSIKVMSADDMEQKFAKYAKTDQSGRMINFQKIIPIAHKFNIMPGDFVQIIGDTGLGKSALSQLIACKLKHLKIDYYNLEFSEMLYYRRMVQIEHGMSEDEVLRHYGINNNSLKAGLEHISVIKTSPDVFQFKDLITSRRPGLAIIDTIDKIRIGKLGEYRSREEKLGHMLKDLAEELDIILIGIHHVPKSAIRDARGKRKKLNVHSGGGDSALEQQADIVIGIEGIKSSNLRQITSLKARDENPFSVECKYDYNKTFRITKIMDLKIDESD